MNSPFIVVIFGATGDLMHRKLMPALYKLYAQKLISDNVFIVGVGRREMTTDQFREAMAQATQEGVGKDFDLDTWGNLIDGMYYTQGYFENPELYNSLVSQLARFDETMKACVPRFFYLATPPQHYNTILTHLNTSKLSEGCGQGTNNFTRILIEKPFGKDLETAKELDKQLAATFEEKQIYRIDHYLGKETVQNILAFRFGNGIFEPTWNSEFIDHVQITLAEPDGVGKRGAFYDGVGALRDVVQNHILEMLALIAMEQPKGLDPVSIRDARVRAITSIDCIESNAVGATVVRGQYEGYTKEKQIAQDSQTETFVALKLLLDTKRWRGVPFYIRTGKKLKEKVTEISLHYKKPFCAGDVCFFNPEKIFRNVLSLRIQPDEGISLRLMVKKPGFGMTLAPTEMEFSYGASFGQKSQPDAYERLLLDAISGDQTLFARTDGIEASWTFVTKILDGFNKNKTPLFAYAPGSWGPKESDKLIEKDGRHWFLHSDEVK